MGETQRGGERKARSEGNIRSQGQETGVGGSRCDCQAGTEHP